MGFLRSQWRNQYSVKTKVNFNEFSRYTYHRFFRNSFSRIFFRVEKARLSSKMSEHLPAISRAHSGPRDLPFQTIHVQYNFPKHFSRIFSKVILGGEIKVDMATAWTIFRDSGSFCDFEIAFGGLNCLANGTGSLQNNCLNGTLDSGLLLEVNSVNHCKFLLSQ